MEELHCRFERSEFCPLENESPSATSFPAIVRIAFNPERYSSDTSRRRGALRLPDDDDAPKLEFDWLTFTGCVGWLLPVAARSQRQRYHITCFQPTDRRHHEGSHPSHWHYHLPAARHHLVSVGESILILNASHQQQPHRRPTARLLRWQWWYRCVS